MTEMAIPNIRSMIMASAAPLKPLADRLLIAWWLAALGAEPLTSLQQWVRRSIALRAVLWVRTSSS